jgi:hypothetical protein
VAARPKNAWDRITDEPALWFGRFARYLALGPTRNLVAAYQADWKDAWKKLHPGLTPPAPPRTAPGTWKHAAAVWLWQQRADAYDVAETQRMLEKRGAEVELLTGACLTLLRGFAAKVGAAAKALDVENPRLGDVSAGVRVVAEATAALRTALKPADDAGGSDLLIRFPANGPQSVDPQPQPAEPGASADGSAG